MKSRSIIVLSCVILLAAMQACKRNTPGKNYNDTYNSGSLTFVADESFAPIVSQELYIFKNDNKDAKPVNTYASENEALKLLLTDSVRFAFLSRDLDTSEKKIIEQHILPVVTREFAIDAVTIIVNEASTDTSTSVD